VLQEVGKRCLPHAANRKHASGDANVHAWLELLRRLRTILRQDLRNRVGGFERIAVRLVSERLELARTRQALVNEISFERQKCS
jgi:hypothetical protein